ncbi:MAG: FecR domain-containing protein [Clostridium sp.]|nr:FecR domain-containing protein [Clostridium sp.]
MEERFKRYIEGNINIEDLEILRRDVDHLSDNELSNYIDECGHDASFSQADVKKLQAKIMGEIGHKQKKNAVKRIYASCAAALIPIILALGFIIFLKSREIYECRELLAKQVEICTGRGEYISAVLPDGSRANIGPESTLSYKVGTFCGEERAIDFSGEGDFKIAKVPNSSFVLLSKNLKIQVLGTEFSVYSRSGSPNSEVYLDKGSIQLTALTSNICKLMKPGETAIINNLTGGIQMFGADSNVKRTAGQDIIYFSSTPLSQVADKIELYYGRDVMVEGDKGGISFTGSLPTNDIKQAAYILENTLNIEFAVDESNDRYVIR